MVSRDHTWRNIALNQQILTECLLVCSLVFKNWALCMLYLLIQWLCTIVFSKLANGGLIPNLPTTLRMARNASSPGEHYPTTLGIFYTYSCRMKSTRESTHRNLHPTMTAMCECTGCTLYNSDVIMPIDK